MWDEGANPRVLAVLNIHLKNDALTPTGAARGLVGCLFLSLLRAKLSALNYLRRDAPPLQLCKRHFSSVAPPHSCGGNCASGRELLSEVMFSYMLYREREQIQEAGKIEPILGKAGTTPTSST